MKILGIGDPCMDFLAFAEELPQRDKLIKLQEFGWQGGGKIATALAAAGRLGADVRIIGGVGDDAWGHFCIDDLKRHHVDTSGIFQDPGKETEFCICISEPIHMSRCLVYKRGSARTIGIPDLRPDFFAEADLVHLPYMTAREVPEMGPVMLEAARLAHAHGAQVSVDLDFAPTDDSDFAQIDILAASQYFFQNRFGDRTDYEACCDEMLALGVKKVIFTLGVSGCVGKSVSEPYFFAPGFKVNVMDTTGAGDVFHGALLYALTRNMPWQQCAVFANAVAAIKCTRIGGRAGIPDLATVQNFLKTATIDYTDIDQRVEFYRGKFLGGS